MMSLRKGTGPASPTRSAATTSSTTPLSPAPTVRWVLAATVISGISGFIVMLLAFRSLGSAGYAVFGVFWSTLFLIVGILFGIQQETTRATAVGLQSVGQAQGRRSLWAFASYLAAGVVAVVLLTSLWWAPPTLGTENSSLALQVALGAGANVFVATFSGVFAGASRWKHLASIIALDGVIRFVGIAGVLAWGGNVQLLGWAVILPFPLSLAIVFASTPRTTMRLSWTSDRFGRLLANSAHTVVAAAAMALIVNGFPMVLAFFAGSNQQDELGALILAITFTRAPVLVPLFALQSYLITRFSSTVGVGRLMGQAFCIVGAVLVVLAGATALWGEPVFSMLGHGTFALSSAALVPLVVSSGFIGALCITSAVLVAKGRHRAYAFGWVVAAGASIAILFLPLSLEGRAALALSVGPLAGLGLHAISIHRLRRRPD